MTSSPESSENSSNNTVMISDREMKNLFGPSYVQYSKNNHHFRTIEVRNYKKGDDHIFYSEVDFIRALFTAYQYDMTRAEGKIPRNIRPPAGLISHSQFTQIQATPWWAEKVPQIDTYLKSKNITASLVDIVSRYVLEPTNHNGIVQYRNT